MVIAEKTPKLSKIKKYCTEFADNTTLHGLRYFVDGNTFLIHKIWWLAAICLSAYICVTLISSNWKKWEENAVFLSTSQSPMKRWEIPFPAVTICPGNQIWASEYNFNEMQKKFDSGKMNETEKQNFASVAMFCNVPYYLSMNHSLSIDDLNFIINNSRPASAFIYCLWDGRLKIKCRDLLSSIFTNEGHCFSFNMLDKNELFTNKTYISPGHIEHPNISYWNFDDNYAKTKEIGYPFRFTSVTESLYITPEDALSRLNENCDHYQGFRIFVHHPAELPSQEFVRIEHNHSYEIEITPLATITNPSLKSYKPERRNCFYSYERPLKFFKIYTQFNCETECLANFTLKTCGCTPYYLPHEKHTPICGWSKSECQLEAEESFYDMEMISEISNSESHLAACNCLPSCTSVEYNFEIKSTLKRDISPLSVIIASDITFRFSDKILVPMIRNELFGDTDFWANTGGILGLCLGFSAMTLFEIFYYLTLKWMYNICCLYKTRSRRYVSMKQKMEKYNNIAVTFYSC